MKPKLLSVSSDAKTRKGESRGFLTGICYMAPANEATKKSVCPYSTPECRAACLYKAGRGAMPNVIAARQAKARRFEHNPSAFAADLHLEIAGLVADARLQGMIPCVRPNGTADIMWERISYTLDGEHHESLMHAFPDVQFYDYTKIPVRMRKPTRNYHLTFSYSGANLYDAHEALRQGVNVAMVFANEVPDTHVLGDKRLPVFNGDQNDLRFLDPRGCIVGLRAKGPARKVSSVFVTE